MNNLFQTIAAISTPPGKGGVALIRVSGENAVEISARVFVPRSKKALGDYPARVAIYGDILGCEHDKIDDGIAVVYRAPHSYTGEDTVEISCHGGAFLASCVLESLFLAGARPALPGEYTRRAFLAGKLSLIEAEGIGDLLDAHSVGQVKLASRDARSRLSRAVGEVHDDLVSLLSRVYVKIDYPDEDLEDVTSDELLASLRDADEKLQTLVDTYRTGHAVAEGVKTVICGTPNVGKSSVYNLLCGDDLAIVTDIAGTTRDLLEHTVSVGRVTLRLYDTAGIRETSDPIEKLGVERAEAVAGESELIFAVFDASRRLSDDDRAWIDTVAKQSACKIALLNKSDLPAVTTKEDLTDAFDDVLSISAHDPGARDVIARRVDRLLTDERLSLSDDAIVSNARQYASLVEARAHLANALAAARAALPFDAVSSDLERAAGTLAELDGREVNDEIVNTIFSRFCVGK